VSIHEDGGRKPLILLVVGELQASYLVYRRARVKAIRGAPDVAELFGVVSRRAGTDELDEEWDSVLTTMEVAQSDTGADGFILCQENSRHTAVAREVSHHLMCR
jgi:hypothetical protein